MSEPVGRVVVVTGLSGAGKSTALHALEDLGFYCVDNLPVPVIPAALEACEQGGVTQVGFGIDVRVRSFLDRAISVIESITGGRWDVEVLFLDASDETLLRRFSSTRRPHPLSHTVGNESVQATAVLDGVRLERERMAPLRDRAAQIIDTTELSVHDLRRRILGDYGPGVGAQPRMRTRLLSFGFKYGPPVDADLVFDVRFLKNPFFVEELRPLTGRDQEVSDYVFAAGDAREFRARVEDLLEFCLPRYEREGKSYLTVAVGCTGGRHRSVAMVEAMAGPLEKRTGLKIEVVHRDVARDNIDSRSMDGFLGGVPKGGRGTP